jgi:Rrf2 family nitric oxide-sensitive transcriptional repressor
MQLTRFTDLGLRIVMRLTVGPDGLLPGTRAVAEELDIPYTHAAKVVARLSELGVVTARRGRGGGLAVTELGRQASLGWLTRQLEGDQEVVTCEGERPCPFAGACALRAALRSAKEAFYASLDQLAVGDLTKPPMRTVLLSLAAPPAVEVVVPAG